MSEPPQIIAGSDINNFTYLKGNKEPRACSSIHVPYHHNNAPFDQMRLVPCLCCKKKWVPEVILTTVEPSTTLTTRGKSRLLEARVCRLRRVTKKNNVAVEISEALPFIEYDVQRQMMLKLKFHGYNAAFGYSNKIQIGQDMIIAIATCTAVYLEALPPPPLYNVKNSKDDPRSLKLQKQLEELSLMNRALFANDPVARDQDGKSKRKDSNADSNKVTPSEDVSDSESSGSSSSSSSSSSDSSDDASNNSLESPESSESESDSDDGADPEATKESIKEQKRSDQVDDNVTKKGSLRSTGIGKGVIGKYNRHTTSSRRQIFKDTRPPIIFEIDDDTDADVMAILSDWRPPKLVEIVNLSYVPGSPRSNVIESVGMNITVLSRSKLSGHITQRNALLSKVFHDVYSRLCFKVRQLIPCQVLGLSHTMNILEDDLVELVINAVVYSIKSTALDNIKLLHNDIGGDYSTEANPPSCPTSSPIIAHKKLYKAPLSDSLSARSPARVGRKSVLTEQLQLVSVVNVILTPLSSIPGHNVVCYLGPIQLHFIKDSWTARCDVPFDNFIFSLISQADVIVKSHTASLGGNALLSYRITPQESGGRVYRNQAYHMFTITGDAVILEENKYEPRGKPIIGLECNTEISSSTKASP